MIMRSILKGHLPTVCLRTASKSMSNQLISKCQVHMTAVLRKDLKDQSLDDYNRVYKFPYAPYVALYQRTKIYLSSALVLLSSWAYYMSSNNALFFGGALISTCGVFYTGEIMRKVVGNVYIHKEDLTKVRFARVGFWGKREDLVVDIDDIKLLGETVSDPKAILWTIEFQDDKHPSLYISTKYGGIEDKEMFRLIFGKMDDGD